MQPSNNRETKGASRTTLSRGQSVAAAVRAQPTLKWAWWMCARFLVEIPRRSVGTELQGNLLRLYKGVKVDWQRLTLTEWDFNTADRRTKYRKWMQNAKPLLQIGSPIDSGGEDKERTRGVLHLAFICVLVRNTTARGSVFLSRTLTVCKQLGTIHSCGLHEQVFRHVPDNN